MIPWIKIIIYCSLIVITGSKVNNAHQISPVSPLEIITQWNVADYNFEWSSPVNDKDYYNPENIVATGIAITHDKIFVATPRLFSGVPATLSTLSRNQLNASPVLQAYPDWSFHTVSLKSYNCSDLGLVSVYRFRIDSCNRLWALDAGISRSLEDYEVTCPPKILVFDLDTNQVVRRIDFPREVRRGETLFTNLIIDETTSSPNGKCDDVFVYISDTVEPAIVVYDSAKDLTWRVTHPAMYPDPDFAQSDIRGDRFILMDGVVGLAFDEKTGIIYFQPLATDRLFSVTKEVLRSGPIAINQVLPVKLVGKKSSQGLGLTVSPADGSVIFSPLTELAIAQWNPATNEQRVLAYDEESLQFGADLTFSRVDPGALYILTSKFQRFFLKNLNVNEINTRILRIQLLTPSPSPYYQFPTKPIFPSQLPTITVKPSSQILIPKVKPFEFSEQYFNSIRQPYQYEPVGLINRGLNNPFTALNTGEQFKLRKPSSTSSTSLLPTPSTSTVTFYDTFYTKINPEYVTYNNLRVAKSIPSRNITKSFI